MSRTPTTPAPPASLPAQPDDRFSHADSKVFVYWLRREKSCPPFVFPLDYFFLMGREVVIRECERIAGYTITESEIKAALGK